MRSVAWAAAPNIDQAYPEWPCSSKQGRKWSLITEKSKPACSAWIRSLTRSLGERCSHISCSLPLPTSYLLGYRPAWDEVCTHLFRHPSPLSALLVAAPIKGPGPFCVYGIYYGYE